MHAHTQSLSAAWNRKGIKSSPLRQSGGASGLGNQGPLHELLSRDLTDMLNKGGGEREGKGGEGLGGGGEGRGGEEREGKGMGALNLQYHTQTHLCVHIHGRCCPTHPVATCQLNLHKTCSEMQDGLQSTPLSTEPNSLVQCIS